MLSLRRDVYLDACELVVKAAQVMLNLANPEYPSTKAGAVIDEFSGALAKLHGIAEQPTVGALLTFTRALLENYAILASKKVCWEANSRELQTIDQILIAQARARPRPATEAEVEKDLNRRVDTLLEQGLRKRRLQKLNVELQAELITRGIEVSAQLGPLIAEVTLAVRRELRLSTNELWYRSEVDENMRLLKETTDTIAIEIRANAEKAAINTPDVRGDAASSTPSGTG